MSTSSEGGLCTNALNDSVQRSLADCEDDEVSDFQGASSEFKNPRKLLDEMDAACWNCDIKAITCLMNYNNLIDVMDYVITGKGCEYDCMEYANNEKGCWSFEYDCESYDCESWNYDCGSCNEGNAMKNPKSKESPDSIKRKDLKSDNDRMLDEMKMNSSKVIARKRSEADALLNFQHIIKSLEETKNKLEEDLDHKDAHLLLKLQKIIACLRGVYY